MTAPARELLDAFAGLDAVDTTCHVGQWPYRLTAGASSDDLRAYAQRHGLRALWVSHLATLTGFDTRTGNEALLRGIGDDPLFRLFAVLDPEAPGWRSELAWAVESGFAGIRLVPGDHGTTPERMLPVLEDAAASGMPVQILVRLDDARVRHPRSPARDVPLHELADVVRAAPVHPLVLSGLNRADWSELSRHLGDDVPGHVLMDLWHVNGPTFVADRWGDDPGRWVFGSGFPVQTPEATMLQLMVAKLDDEPRRRIAGGNAAAILPRRG